MAFNQDIQAFARRIGGDVDVVALSSSYWTIDDPLTRLASCAFSLEEPFDAAAAPTHMMFVGREGFEAALERYPPDHLIGMVSDLADGVRRKPDYYRATVGEVAKHLQDRMADPECPAGGALASETIFKQISAVQPVVWCLTELGV